MRHAVSPPLFDPGVLRDAAAGDDALVRELLEIFLRIVPPMTARLREAVELARTAAIAEEAHSLRSCLATVGAARTELQCRQLEALARRGEAPVAAEGAAACRDLERLIGEVAAYYAQHAGHAGE